MCSSDLQNQRFWILIEDDGNGFSPENQGLLLEGEHIGLSAMEQRMKAIGGTLEIESEPGEGTRITITGTTRDRSEKELFDLL